jgi:N-terminal half of MaoC dehydratase
MDLDRKALIGHTFPACRCVLDEENVGDYVGVVGESHPAFSSEAGARTGGYQRRVIPPSYAPLIALSSLLRTIDWAKDFGLDYSTGTSMFGEQEMVYRRPLYLGETLNIAGTVLNVIEKRGKRPFDLVTIGVAATDEAGVLAFSGSMGFIIFK